MSKRKKKNKINYILLIGVLLVIVIILLIMVFNNKSNVVITNYNELYEFNNNGYNDKKYDLGSKEYFLNKTNYIFYYLYNNTDIDENIEYDTLDLEDDFVSYLTNIIYSNGISICYSKDMIDSMSYYLLGRGIKVNNTSKYYDVDNNNICFKQFDYKYNNLINNIEITDNNSLKNITFSLPSDYGKYTFIYKFDNSYNTYYLYKYSYKIEYNEDHYVYDEDSKEEVLVGQD